VSGLTFEGWPKTPRLSAKGSMVVTEKIDGTNACVIVQRFGEGRSLIDLDLSDPQSHNGICFVFEAAGPDEEDRVWLVGAQSRNKLIFPGKHYDNAGFAGWVLGYALELVSLLGPGRHFGEWWGQGIQRGYGMECKKFSLFDAHRWARVAIERGDWNFRADRIGMTTVPTLHIGQWSDSTVEDCLGVLRRHGSMAALQFGVVGQKAEGVVVRHRALGGNLKAFVDNDDTPKGQQV